MIAYFLVILVILTFEGYFGHAEIRIPKAARKYKTKISHWDTGLLFAYDYSKYHHGRLGPVCQGSRDFTINEAFGKVSCNENGFKELDFIGNIDQYKEFIKTDSSMLGDSFWSDQLADNKILQCLPEFRLGGAKCKGDEKKIDDCLVIDYLESGGNCLTKSSVFIKCSGYKYPGSVKLGFEHSQMVRTCSTCGETILGAQEAFVCAPKEEYTDEEFPPTSNDAKYVCFGKPWLNIQKCEKCNVTDDYAYNANYYDSSDTSEDSSYYYPYESESTDADFRSPVPQSGRPDSGPYPTEGPKRRRKSDKKLKMDDKVENCSWNLDPKQYCPIGWPKKLKLQYCDLSNDQNSFLARTVQGLQGRTPSRPPTKPEVGSTKPEVATNKPEVEIEQAAISDEPQTSPKEFNSTKILLLSSILLTLLLI